jgi:hypothetical protein
MTCSAVGRAALLLRFHRVGFNSLSGIPTYSNMTQWQTTREPKKTKAELYEMLAEAVRNTAQPEIKRPSRPKKIAAKAA